MFVGTLHGPLHKFLAQCFPALTGKTLVVGCSGAFAFERVFALHTPSLPMHSHDVSLASCLLGHYFAGTRLPVGLADGAYDWLMPYLDAGDRCLAAVLVLLDMLPFAQQRHAHQQRMWANYRQNFAELVEATLSRLVHVDLRLTSFFAGDVFTHFERFADTPHAVFCCVAPPCSGDGATLHKTLDTLFTWDAPTYPVLDEERRASLLAWMRQRDYLWYDDRLLPDASPVFAQQKKWGKTVYLYSNVVGAHALVRPKHVPRFPKIPLADHTLCLTDATPIACVPLKIGGVTTLKEAFLGKAIAHSTGDWGFLVYAAAVAIGCLEFRRGGFHRDEMYLNADFPFPGTRYRRLSKLIALMACAGETRQMLERIRERRLRTVATTAFTDKPVSMKYRGVLALVNRGTTPAGQQFLNYAGTFTTLSWQETYTQWWTQYSSVRSLAS